MAECTYCKAETHLYELGIPVCVACADRRVKGKQPATHGGVRRLLVQQLSDAVARADAASENFSAVMGQIPSGTPHSDGAQRIKNASREMSNARDEMMKAHHRLNEFILSGIVPDDPKSKH